MRRLLTQQDPLFDRAALDEAIRPTELRHRTTNPDFHGFTAQQRRAFNSFDRRLAVWSGDAGVGKSVLNEVHRTRDKPLRRALWLRRTVNGTPDGAAPRIL